MRKSALSFDACEVPGLNLTSNSFGTNSWSFLLTAASFDKGSAVTDEVSISLEHEISNVVTEALTITNLSITFSEISILKNIYVF